MMYDCDDDAPPPMTDWADIGWFNCGWREVPPKDAIVGETPTQYERRKQNGIRMMSEREASA